MPLPSGGQLAQKRIGDLVHDGVRDAIITGEWGPGRRLSPTEVIDRFGGSRQTYADAVQRLELDDLVVIRPHRAPVVAPVDRTRTGHAYTVWTAVSEHILLHAFPLLDDGDLRRLDRVAHELERDQAPASVTAALLTIVRVSADRYGQPVLRSMLDHTRQLVDRIDLPGMLSPSALEQRRALTRTMYRSTLDRDPKAFEHAVLLGSRREVPQNMLAVDDVAGDDTDPGPTDRLRDSVFDWLVEPIVDGTLTPGEPLRDREVADRLGVSTATVRHAIRELALIGLVDVSPGRVTTVSHADERMLFAGKHAGLVLMGIGARLGVPRFTTDDVSRVERTIVRIHECVAAGDRRDYIARIADLLGALTEPLGNPLLDRLVRHQQWAQRRFPDAQLAALENRVTDPAVDALLDGVRAADGAAAEAAVSRLRAPYDAQWAALRTAQPTSP